MNALIEDLLGVATPSDSELDSIVSAALGHPATATGGAAERVAYQSGSPATAGLIRVRGITKTCEPWSVFVKILQHPRHWRGLGRVPAELRADFLTRFPWRAELHAWDADFQHRLPIGLRVPRLYHLAELPDDHLAIWMEDIDCSDHPWTTESFELAARLLGRFASNSQDPVLLAASPVPAGHALRMFYAGEVAPALRWLHSHDLWRHPKVIADGGEQLRVDLITLSERAPAILDGLDQRPQSLPHGDASPQNLLVPVDAPNTRVAIDIAFQCPLAVGFDLAQLLVGLVHAGQMHPRELPRLQPLLTRAYADGMSQGTHPTTPEDIDGGFIGSLVIRSAFTSLPFREPSTTLTDTHLDQRMGLTRFITDLGLQRTP
ncbi:MAG TPA: hypothetical protein VII33_21265 [Nakamurella sp.]